MRAAARLEEEKLRSSAPWTRASKFRCAGLRPSPRSSSLGGSKTSFRQVIVTRPHRARMPQLGAAARRVSPACPSGDGDRQPDPGPSSFSLAAGPPSCRKGGTRGSADKAVLGQPRRLSTRRPLHWAEPLMALFAIVPRLAKRLTPGNRDPRPHPRAIHAYRHTRQKRGRGGRRREAESAAPRRTPPAASRDFAIRRRSSRRPSSRAHRRQAARLHGPCARRRELSPPAFRQDPQEVRSASTASIITTENPRQRELPRDAEGLRIAVHGTAVAAENAVRRGRLPISLFVHRRTCRPQTTVPHDETRRHPAISALRASWNLTSPSRSDVKAGRAYRGQNNRPTVGVISPTSWRFTRNNLAQLSPSKDMAGAPRCGWTRVQAPQWRDQDAEPTYVVQTSAPGRGVLDRLLASSRRAQSSIRNLHLVLEAIAEVGPTRQDTRRCSQPRSRRAK